MKTDRQSIDAFYALTRAGLWEQGVRLLPYAPLDFGSIYEIAEDQSVVGLVAAGLEHIQDLKTTQQDVLPFMKKVISLERNNSAMNYFIGVITDKMRDAGIYSLLVKGQGVAQCYERPLWRSAGDIDLLLDKDNYERAKVFLVPLAISVDTEDLKKKHLSITIAPWVVELHGTLHGNLSSRIDRALDRIQEDSFVNGHVRAWRNGETDVFIPDPDNDIVFIFTHILQHFFKGGIGLRQICDWCRLLWRYRNAIDVKMLETRIRQMHLMTEWLAFSSYAVNYLGMSVEVMPLYSPSDRWKRKASRINAFIIKLGNFGHNQDMSYLSEKPYIVRKFISLFHSFQYTMDRILIFPVDAILFYFRYLFSSSKATLNGQ